MRVEHRERDHPRLEVFRDHRALHRRHATALDEDGPDLRAHVEGLVGVEEDLLELRVEVRALALRELRARGLAHGRVVAVQLVDRHRQLDVGPEDEEADGEQHHDAGPHGDEGLPGGRRLVCGVDVLAGHGRSPRAGAGRYNDTQPRSPPYGVGRRARGRRPPARRECRSGWRLGVGRRSRSLPSTTPRIPPGSCDSAWIRTAQGTRLDRALALALPEHSRTVLAGWIADGLVLVDGRALPGKTKVAGGEAVEIRVPPTRPLTVEPQDIPLVIVYEDEVLLVVDKPSGLTVHPGSGQPDGTLANALAYHFGPLPEAIGADRPGIVHRLDKDTSGAIVVAKNERVQRDLSAAFAARTVKKTYLACVHGAPAEDEGVVDLPIGRHPGDRKKMTIAGVEGRPATTRWEVDRRLPRHTLIRCFPVTGPHAPDPRAPEVAAAPDRRRPDLRQPRPAGRGPRAAPAAARVAPRVHAPRDGRGDVLRGAAPARLRQGAGAAGEPRPPRAGSPRRVPGPA